MIAGSAPEEIRTLTGVRAYAAVWVMLLHLPFSLGVIPHVRHGAVTAHGAWGVDVFFVLSGFILSLLYAPRFAAQPFAATYRRYLAARFARIYPLHVAALAVLVVAVVAAASAGMPREPAFGFRNLALSLGLLHGWGYADRLIWNYPSWSIGSEWFAYLLLTPALALGLRRRSAGASLALAAALWLALYFALHGQGQLIRDQAISWSVPRIGAEFTLGYALYRVYAALRLAPRAADALALAGVAGIIVLCFLPDAFEWALAPAIAILILGLSQPGPAGTALFGNRWAVFWGERSYAIYMLHAVVQTLSNLLLRALGWTELAAGPAFALLAALVVAVLAAAHLAYRFVEVPARARLRAALDGTGAVARAPAAAQPAP